MWLALGELHGKIGNRDLQIEAYESAIRRKPDLAAAYRGLGQAWGSRGERGKSTEAYRSAVRLDTLDWQSWFSLGRACFELGRFGEAAEAYKAVIRVSPGDESVGWGLAESAHWGLAAAYSGLRRAEEFDQTVKKAMALAPDRATAFLDLGNCYNDIACFCSDRDAYAKGIAACNNAIATQPGCERAYQTLIMLYSNCGKREDAIRTYQSLLKLNPHTDDFHRRIAYGDRAE